MIDSPSNDWGLDPSHRVADSGSTTQPIFVVEWLTKIFIIDELLSTGNDADEWEAWIANMDNDKKPARNWAHSFCLSFPYFFFFFF